MVKIGYHCSLEQFAPQELLHYAILAEQAGFRHLSCSDHFAPWSHSQGYSSNAWCWMAAVLSSTKMSCGTVSCSGYRYHPALIAQMAATLDALFPGRFWLALGSGEYLNEQFAIDIWPQKEIRNKILKEGVEIIRKLLEGQQVTHSTEHLKVNSARLYDFPAKPIPLLGAALSKETAEFIEPFTDGLITVGLFDHVKENVQAYRKKNAKKKMILKLDVSYASTPEEALEWGWDQWRFTQVEKHLLSDLRYPEQFEKASQTITKDQFADKIIIAHTPGNLEKSVRQFSELGFDQINLHNVNKEQKLFITAAAELLCNGSFNLL